MPRCRQRSGVGSIHPSLVLIFRGRDCQLQLRGGLDKVARKPQPVGSVTSPAVNQQDRLSGLLVCV